MTAFTGPPAGPPESNRLPVIGGVAPAVPPGPALFGPPQRTATGGATVDAMLTVLRGLLGVAEVPPGSNQNLVTVWFTANVCDLGTPSFAWCEATVMYSLGHIGYDLKGKVEDTVVPRWMAWTVGVAQGAQKRGEWHWGTAGIQPGDTPYYNWETPYGASHDINTADHTGTVERVVDASHRYVIEGNIGDVCRRELRDDTFLVGSWRPDYDVPAPPPRPAPTDLIGMLTQAQLDSMLAAARVVLGG